MVWFNYLLCVRQDFKYHNLITLAPLAWNNSLKHARQQWRVLIACVSFFYTSLLWRDHIIDDVLVFLFVLDRRMAVLSHALFTFLIVSWYFYDLESAKHYVLRRWKIKSQYEATLTNCKGSRNNTESAKSDSYSVTTMKHSNKKSEFTLRVLMQRHTKEYYR